MYYIKTSSMIREFRKRKHLEQMKLAEISGVNSVTLSFIENDNHNIHPQTFDSLAKELGCPVSLGYHTTLNEYERLFLESQIIGAFEIGVYDIPDLIEKYKNVSDDFNVFEQQFFLYAKNVLAIHEGRADYGALLEESEKAIRLTFSDYNRNCLVLDHLFTDVEFAILITIVDLLYRLKQFSEALSMLSSLCTIIKNPDTMREMFAIFFPFISYYYAMTLFECESYEKSARVADEGRKCCIKYGKLYLLDKLLNLEGNALKRKSNNESGEKYLAQEQWLHEFMVHNGL